MISPGSFDEPMRVDRAAHRRPTVDLGAAVAVAVADGQVLADADGVVLLAPGTWPDESVICYLGLDGDQDVVAVSAGSLPEPPGSARPEALRSLLGRLGADDRGHRDRELATTAVAMDHWHGAHGHCPRCGTATEPGPGGWHRRCPRCERDHYPRTDPAVIVAITDAEDRLLMAHASYWSARRFSHLAGYVEPGESLEQAVHREVAEESSLRLEDLEYVGSQPWPFPASMMVGYTAKAVDVDFALDLDEISEARWVRRDELEAAVTEGSMIIAPRGSIARRLLEDWHGDGDALTRLQGD
ncbi:NAD(+) diphosphatase [Demequina sp. NBRC 110056]|uniref:NAD(+) diphosphatase n=1 Tax=Demequina sp. NBRC 110056 TaxID=1570345 RepID=UPI00118100CC|nr:NAD(+) diphosphatase [Demequina sp. NBRC 110056]